MSATIPVYSLTGSTLPEPMMVPEQWLSVKKLKPGAIAQVATALRSHQRQVLAHTKTRADVSGGGKKPWKQKGTGRARQGSIRSPQWKGGGVVFGPRSNRNYFLRINKTLVRRAFDALLHEHVAEGGLAVLETTSAPESKTKTMATAVKNISSQWVVAGQNVRPSLRNPRLMMVVAGSADAMVRRMTRNLKECALTDIAEFGVLDLLQYPALLLTTSAFEQLKKRTVRAS